MIGTRQDLNKAVILIKEGQSNDAFKLISDCLKEKIINYLTYYRWSKEEALDIFHDSLLFIEEKVLRNNVSSINTTYIKKICKNLGANSYRTIVRNQQAFQKYLDETKRELLNEYDPDDELGLFNDEFPDEYQHALRAFDLLSVSCKQIIEQKHIQGLNHREIAQINQNISSENSSKTILNRCMKSWRYFINKIASSKNEQMNLK